MSTTKKAESAPEVEAMSSTELVCRSCKMPAAEFDDDESKCSEGVYLCPVCVMDRDEAAATDEAREYALQNCRITKELPKYDPKLHEAVTPEEYESGFRESHTPNALLAYARHECTNYDELIEGLARIGDGSDRAYYSAIRRRIDEMIREAEPSIGGELGLDDEEP